jgi:trigger factor
MKATFIAREDNKVKFDMAFDAEEFENAQVEIYKKTKGDFRIDGFRPGKAPRKMIEQRYGEGVFIEDALEDMLQTGYPDALSEMSLEPIDRPTVDFGEVKKGEGVTVTVTVEVPPEIELKDYTGVKIPNVIHEVTAADVDKELESLRERNARWVETDAEAAIDDIVNLDYAGFVGEEQFEGGTGENHALKLGSGQFIPGFEDQLVGVKKGDKKDVTVTFPDEYHSEALQGKEAVFHVTVNNVQHQEKPDLDDEFAKDASEFDSLEALRSDTERKLKEIAAAKEESEKKNAVLEAVYEAHEIEVPDIMVEDQIDSMMNEFAQSMRQEGLDLEQYLKVMGKEADAFRERLREEACKKVKMRLIIKAVVKAEGFTASEDEVEQELKQMAAMYGIEAENLKAVLGDAQISLVEEDIRNRKAVDYMFEMAVVE